MDKPIAHRQGFPDSFTASLVALMPAAVYTCDAAGRLTFFNRKAVEIWGREPPLGDDQERYCGSFRMWTPDGHLLKHEDCPMADALRDGRAGRDLEVVIEQPDGTRLIANVNIDPIFDDAGNITGAINVFVDVTDRKRNEALLASQREALECALNGEPLTASLGILGGAVTAQYGCGTRFAFYLANDERTSLRHVVGMSEDYAAAVDGFLIGQDSLASSLATATGEAVLTTDVEEEVCSEPWREMARRFQYRGCWSFPIHSRKGEFVGTFALYWPQPAKAGSSDIEVANLVTNTAGIIIGRDLEARHRRAAEASLRESEERFQQLGASSSDAIWVRNAHSWDFEYVSPAVQTIFGVTPQAVLADARLLNALIIPEERDEASRNVERVSAGEVVVQEYRIQRAGDLTFRWIRSTGFPLCGGDGDIQRIGSIAQDITEAKLAAGHQATLLAELQHRVRNVLAIVRSVTVRTGERASSVQDYADILSGRLLALARVQALLTRGANLSVNIRDVVHDEVSVQAQHEGQYRIEGPDISLSPKAAEILTLVVHELGTNAMKYGALSVADGRVKVEWATFVKRGIPWLRFVWTESGSAAAPIAAATVPRRRGFGRELIEARVPYELGGQGSVVIEAGKVQCHLEFPLANGASVFETGAPQRLTVFGGALDMTGAPDLHGYHILIVEDEYYIATDTARALQGAGATVIGPCGNEMAAQAELAMQTPDAVVLDINLGHGASFKLAEHLQENGIPFVFVTGYDADIIPPDFAGVERLVKPLQLRQVVGAISRLLQATV